MDVGDFVAKWGVQVLGAIALLVFGWMAAGVVRGVVRRGLERTKLDPTLVPFLTKLVYYAFLVFIVVAVLNLFGVAHIHVMHFVEVAIDDRAARGRR